MKIFKYVFLLILVLLLGAGTYLYINFGNLSKHAVEKVASDAMNVSVKISSLKLSLKEKSITVHGLRIANPKGYKKPYAVQVGAISVSLAEVPENFDFIQFKLINVSDTVVNLEVNQKGTNLNDLKNGMAKGSSNNTGSQIKIALQKFYINQSTLNPTITLIGGDLSAVKVPPVTLTGIGTKANGVLAKDAIKQILTQYLNTATKEASKAGYLKGITNVDVDATVKDLKTKAKDEIKDKIPSNLKGFLGN